MGVSYDVPPNQVKAAIAEALAQRAAGVCGARRPTSSSPTSAPSAVIYRVRFWIDDYAQDSAARDQVRSAIYYSLRRHGYEIPFPMQVEIPRPEEPERASERIDRLSGILQPVALFAPLAAEQRDELAARAVEQLYGQGETIVRQGERRRFDVRRPPGSRRGWSRRRGGSWRHSKPAATSARCRC